MNEKVNNKFPGRSLKSYAGWLDIHTNYDDTPPLFNNQILSRVMAYLPKDDLLNSRLVCKAWTAPATDEISKDAVVLFDSGSLYNPRTGMAPFISDMCRIERPLIRRIHLLGVNFRHPFVFAFFNSYGKHIWELRLEDEVECEANIFEWPEPENPNQIRIKDIRSLIMFYVPNLKYLEIMNVSSELLQEGIFFDWYKAIMTETLLKSGAERPTQRMRPSSRGSLCNLQRLRIKPAIKFLQREYQLIEDLIWASDQLREIHVASGVVLTPILQFLWTYGRFSNLKTLVISSFTMEQIQILINATASHHLKLEHFQCSLKLELCDALGTLYLLLEKLSEFLNGQKESLKVLRINADPKALFPLTLETMPKLQELKMVPADCNIPAYLSFAPNLKIVSFSGLKTDIYGESSWNRVFPSKGRSLETVTNLELPYGFKQATRLKSFIQYFPNVVILTAKGMYEPMVLVSLWNAWPKLESLTLEIAKDFDEETTDWIFTGVSRKMYHSWHYGLPHENIMSELRKLPSIANLQSLRYLEITTSPTFCHSRFAMTKVTGYFALMIMPQLKTLLLPTSKIEKECANRLIETLKLERFHFDYRNGGSYWWRM